LYLYQKVILKTTHNRFRGNKILKKVNITYTSNNSLNIRGHRASLPSNFLWLLRLSSSCIYSTILLCMNLEYKNAALVRRNQKNTAYTTLGDCVLPNIYTQYTTKHSTYSSCTNHGKAQPLSHKTVMLFHKTQILPYIWVKAVIHILNYFCQYLVQTSIIILLYVCTWTQK
jgi:hypothetical protein